MEEFMKEINTMCKKLDSPRYIKKKISQWERKNWRRKLETKDTLEMYREYKQKKIKTTVI